MVFIQNPVSFFFSYKQVLRTIAFTMVFLLLLQRRYPFGWWLTSLIFATLALILLCIHFKRIFHWDPKVQTAEEAGEDFVNWYDFRQGVNLMIQNCFFLQKASKSVQIDVLKQKFCHKARLGSRRQDRRRN